MTGKIDESIRWIWFDIDDTLINFKANSLTSLRHVYQFFRLDKWFPSFDTWIERYHAANSALWRQYETGDVDQRTLRIRRFITPLVNAGMYEPEASSIASAMDIYYLSRLAEQTLTMPGAVEVVKSLKADGYKIGVLSNGFDGFQQLKLISAGLFPYIDEIVISDCVGFHKPDVRIYHEAMRLVDSTSPGSHLMIGDNPNTDIDGALKAGWQTILYAPCAQREDTDSCHVIKNLTDLIQE